MFFSSQSDSKTIAFGNRLFERVSRLASNNSYENFAPQVDDPSQFSVSNPFVCAYLEARSGRQLTETSVATYENHLGQYLLFLNNRDVHLLDAELTDVIEFVEHCVDRDNRQSTIEGKLVAIRELYGYIRLRTDAADVLTIDPIKLDDIDLAEYNTPEKIKRESLTRSELRKLFDAMDSYRNRLLVIVATETGLRNSDLRNLRVEDIDFNKREIHVRNPKNQTPYDVPISDELAVELKIWCERYLDGYGHSGQGENKYVFPSQHGKKLESNSSLNNIVTEAAERAGIQEVIGTSEVPVDQSKQYDGKTTTREWHRVTVHALRHTCFTLMKQDGVPLPYRQLIANHQDPRTTQHYSHGQEEEFEHVRERFNVPR